MTDYIKDIRLHGKTARGRNELLKHLGGQRLRMKQAILAKCFDCMGYYADGKVDCNMPHCSLYQFMPYGVNRDKLSNKKTKQVEAKIKAAVL